MSEKKAEAKAEEKLDIAALVRTAVSEAVAVGMALSKQSNPHGLVSIQTAKDGIVKGIPCGECGQYLTACKGKHKQVVVYPKNKRLDRAGFKGFSYNGVHYKSNGPRHKVTVPLKCNIEADMQRWERGEENLTVDTGAMRSTSISGRRRNGGRSSRGARR